MNVQELIEELSKIEDKTKKVYIETYWTDVLDTINVTDNTVSICIYAE